MTRDPVSGNSWLPLASFYPRPPSRRGDELASCQSNTIGVRRSLLAAIRVDSAAQVEKIVHHANLCKIALYPVSTGKNWGLGSSTPVVDNCVNSRFGRDEFQSVFDPNNIIAPERYNGL